MGPFIIRQAEVGTTTNARSIVKDAATRPQRKSRGVLQTVPARSMRVPMADADALGLMLERLPGLEYKKDV
jgi:hypothetical protein